MTDTTKKYDAFISHASEDKEDFVRPLANVLTELGAEIWYDEFSLQIGKSLSRSIDKGLSNSRFGIIVLSKSFFEKDWTEYELKGLNAKELGRDEVMLPIWLNITREDVLKFSPTLADKLAVSSSKHSLNEIAIKLLDVIRPDLSENYHKRKVWEDFGKSDGEVKQIDPKKISQDVLFRHKSLPENLMNRIRLIRASLLSGNPHTYNFWVDGFKCDLHPEREIEYWEAVSFFYLEAIQASRVDPKEYPKIFELIAQITQGGISKENEKKLKLPKDTIEKVKKICKYKVPIYEVAVEEKTFGKRKFELDIYTQLNKAKTSGS